MEQMLFPKPNTFAVLRKGQKNGSVVREQALQGKIGSQFCLDQGRYPKKQPIHP
jgi:hypothetical protein